MFIFSRFQLFSGNKQKITKKLALYIFWGEFGK